MKGGFFSNAPENSIPSKKNSKQKLENLHLKSMKFKRCFRYFILHKCLFVYMIIHALQSSCFYDTKTSRPIYLTTQCQVNIDDNFAKQLWERD